MTPTDPKYRVCSAKSKQTGQPCKAPALRGGKVCRFHGGKAPQVIAAAKLRLAALVDPSITTLGVLVKDKKTPAAVRLGAVKDVLDRNGLAAPKSTVDPAGGDFTFEELLVSYRRISSGEGP